MTSALDVTFYDNAAMTLVEHASGGAQCSQGHGVVDDDDEERAPTLRHLPAVFFGVKCPPFPAHLPLPDQRVLGSTDQTVDERVRRSR